MNADCVGVAIVVAKTDVAAVVRITAATIRSSNVQILLPNGLEQTVEKILSVYLYPLGMRYIAEQLRVLNWYI